MRRYALIGSLSVLGVLRDDALLLPTNFVGFWPAGAFFVTISGEAFLFSKGFLAVVFFVVAVGTGVAEPVFVAAARVVRVVVVGCAAGLARVEERVGTAFALLAMSNV